MTTMSAAFKQAGIKHSTLKLKKHRPVKPKTLPAKVTKPEAAQAAREAREQLKRQQCIKAASRWMSKFPVFQLRPVPPLATGLRNDLNARRLAEGCVFGAGHLRAAIARVVVGGNYRKRLIEGATRFDADGVPEGVVTAEQAMGAASVMGKRNR